MAISRLAATKRTTGTQYAALPYRMSGETLEILLITSLRTRRWIIPKGWPQDGREPSSCAALEALEEAGVAGEIEKIAAGWRPFRMWTTVLIHVWLRREVGLPPRGIKRAKGKKNE